MGNGDLDFDQDQEPHSRQTPALCEGSAAMPRLESEEETNKLGAVAADVVTDDDAAKVFGLEIDAA